MKLNEIMLQLHAVRDNPGELERISRRLLEPLHNYRLPDYWDDTTICGLYRDEVRKKVYLIECDRGHICASDFYTWLDVLIKTEDEQKALV